MQCVLVKCFCLRYTYENGKHRIKLVSPFSADQTQVVPKKSGNMKRRAMAYALGGLIMQGTTFFLLLATAFTLTFCGVETYHVWGYIPYMGYLFLLNVLPLEYPGGKTDALVCKGIKKEYPAEKTMLTAMEIQGMLYEGKSFSEIEKTLYFSTPQLPEDEPLFATMLHLRYCYYLETNDLERAADQINRLAASREYLLDNEVEEVAAELVYMHSLNGDFERASECGKLCESYLQSEKAIAKRALAAYCKAFGKDEQIEPLVTSARKLLKKQPIKGVAKFEEILLSRI